MSQQGCRCDSDSVPQRLKRVSGGSAAYHETASFWLKNVVLRLRYVLDAPNDAPKRIALVCHRGTVGDRGRQFRFLSVHIQAHQQS